MLTELDLPVSRAARQAIVRIDRLKQAWASSVGMPSERLVLIEEAARIRSVAASCRLSGIRYSDAEVAGILQDESIHPPQAEFIRGYAAAMSWEHPDSQSLMTCDDLRRLHAVIVGRAGELSDFRDHAYHPEAFDSDGQATGRVFSTLPPHMLQSQCDEMTTWLEFELRSGVRHPLPVIATFAMSVQAACPFSGGNGRLARLLIGVLLRRTGYAFAPFASIESRIEERRVDYYESYDLSRTLFWKGQASLEPWIDFVLDVLKAHALDVEAKLDLERGQAGLPPLQRAILETVREHGVVDAGLLIKATGANRNTLKDNLRRLVDRGALERTGTKRGTRYSLGGTGY